MWTVRIAPTEDLLAAIDAVDSPDGLTSETCKPEVLDQVDAAKAAAKSLLAASVLGGTMFDREGVEVKATYGLHLSGQAFPGHKPPLPADQELEKQIAALEQNGADVSALRAQLQTVQVKAERGEQEYVTIQLVQELLPVPEG